MNRRNFIALSVIGGLAASPAGPWRLAWAAESTDKQTLATARQIHDSVLVVNGLDVSSIGNGYVDEMIGAGVNCWHKSVGNFDSISDLHNFVDSRDDVVIAKSVADIEAAYGSGKLAVVCGWQSADQLGARILNPFYGPPTSSLRGFYELGLRILGLAYNLTNYFGAGNMEGQVPLSRAGKVLVEEVHELNMLLDVGGHTGEQTSLDAIALAPEIPVICSHTNIASIADNPRNVSDRLIDAIAGTGGVVGLTAVNDFHVRTRNDMDVAHSPRMGVSALVDQIAYLRDRVGIDHVGLGPDFVNGRGVNYDLINQSLVINREIISDGPWLYIDGFETIGELPNVTAEMVRRGWNGADIRKVLGENWMRVYKAAWGG